MIAVIEGVEMPKNCRECELIGIMNLAEIKCPCFENFGEGRLKYYNYDKRPDECPIKEVRLV